MIENQQIAAIQKLKRENDIQRKKIEQAKSFEFSKDKRVLQHKKLEAEELKTLQEIENVSNSGSITKQRHRMRHINLEWAFRHVVEFSRAIVDSGTQVLVQVL